MSFAIRRATTQLKSVARLSGVPARSLSAGGLEGFGRHRFMGDVADEFLAPQGMSWADMEDGTWTSDPAQADKVDEHNARHDLRSFLHFFFARLCVTIKNMNN
jgi:hypothetical protein